ncbi:hypothetical protein VI817_005921 [Penicillium citrinum]|nr:hypothetical protein VI817_005921 [Penicillium citrinum]
MARLRDHTAFVSTAGRVVGVDGGRIRPRAPAGAGDRGTTTRGGEAGEDVEGARRAKRRTGNGNHLE